MELDLLSLKEHSHRLTRAAKWTACCLSTTALLGCGGAQPSPSVQPGAASPSAGSHAGPAAERKPLGATGLHAGRAMPAGTDHEATVTMPSGLVVAGTLGAQPLPLPKGTTVLHIGDSFAGALGIELDKALKSRGVRGILRYTTSSYIPTWAWDKNLDQYLSDYQPDLVLITLGGNELEIARPGRRAETVQRLVQRLGGRPCVWIAPPLWKEENGLLEVIQNNLGSCRYMDTNAVIKYMPRAGDKIHPHMNARKDWAQVVLHWLSRERDPKGSRPWQLKRP
jgi:hypothetical protein